MLASIKAIRGMHDILPDQTPLWQFFEAKVKSVFDQYGYQEIRMPIAEKTDLFCRSIGEATDVVEKEMYTFADRNGDNMTLRPEGTASCVRAAQEHGLTYNQVQRLWYHGPMFRYERPQKGRQRQFHQFGAEVYGLEGPDVDAELIIMTARLWRELGLQDAVTLQLNTLGSSAARAAYRTDLVEFLQANMQFLDADSQRRVSTNPLRVLDSKNANTQALLDGAPDFYGYLDDESRVHFERLRELLDAAGIVYQINPRLVRGLDYYCKTVFEWVTDKLGSQGTVCGGGRYDGMIEQLGGKPTPAVGWAMGVERMILLLQEMQQEPAGLGQQADVYLAHIGDGASVRTMQLAEQLRTDISGLRLLWHCGGGSLKNQMKKADRCGAKLVLIMGDDELAQGEIQIKPLQGQGEQQSIPLSKVSAHVAELIK
ncbi:histidine--tRNA ligase [Oceanospirillaceae bacterium]|uniref:histidine--tRNA ligase n=1 Tax=Candidatus Njordibacter sp. Uisw_002 TaxID=3230971 RepID=UPI002370B4F9|nr:histidine--tRNA ligase [Oceanospirillaceae bacterium]MDB9753919.1 histidine--tRNA ligase [Oceanospirillaceae bacterium]